MARCSWCTVMATLWALMSYLGARAVPLSQVDPLVLQTYRRWSTNVGDDRT
jgi:hypothetical protein